MQGMQQALQDGINQNESIRLSLQEMGKQFSAVMEENKNISESTSATVTEVAAAAKHWLDVEDKIAKPITSEFA